MDVVMVVGPERATERLCEHLVVNGYVVCVAEEPSSALHALERGVRPLVLVVDEATHGVAGLLMAARYLGVRTASLAGGTSQAPLAALLGEPGQLDRAPSDLPLA